MAKLMWLISLIQTKNIWVRECVIGCHLFLLASIWCPLSSLSFWLSVQKGGDSITLIPIFEIFSDLAKFPVFVPFLGTQKYLFSGCVWQWECLGYQGLPLSQLLSETVDHFVNSVRVSEAQSFLMLCAYTSSLGSECSYRALWETEAQIPEFLELWISFGGLIILSSSAYRPFFQVWLHVSCLFVLTWPPPQSEEMHSVVGEMGGAQEEVCGKSSSKLILPMAWLPSSLGFWHSNTCALLLP